jgi:hypothetical protein
MASGGKRSGAGRPSKGDRVVLSVRIDREVAETIKSLAIEQGKAQGEIVEDSIKLIKR